MRPPSVGGAPATGGSASCAAKWCSSHCHDQHAKTLNPGDQAEASTTSEDADGSLTHDKSEATSHLKQASFGARKPQDTAYLTGNCDFEY